jgi:hypothetical protein
MKMTADMKAKFLDLLRSGHNVASAAHHIGTTIGKIERRRRRLPAFDAEIEDALRQADRKLLAVLDQKRAKAIISRMDRREQREWGRSPEWSQFRSGRGQRDPWLSTHGGICAHGPVARHAVKHAE